MGQRGDQKMQSGNAAILNHKSDGRALRVFDGARGTVTYVAGFVIADDEPTSPIDDLLHRTVETVPVEQHMTEKAWVAPNEEGHELERHEQKLVLAYQKHLEAHGVSSGRLKIVPPGEHKPLSRTSTSPISTCSSKRREPAPKEPLRMAIGQLADYRRFVDPVPTCAVLLPGEPRPDLWALLEAEDVVAIWQDGPPSPTRQTGRSPESTRARDRAGRSARAGTATRRP